MNLVPYTFNRPLERFGGMFNRFFSDFSPMIGRDDFERDFWTSLGAPFQGPAIDVEEIDDKVLVRAEMPGLEKDDFRIELSNGNLLIQGEKKQQNERKDGAAHRIECSYGSFSRRISLPCEVEEDNAEAEYKNGVLTITLPKSENARRKSITVKVQ
jgi:HSP20 family protein